MGLYLELLILKKSPSALGDTSVGWYDTLSFDQNYEIFDQLSDWRGATPTIKTLPLPPQMQVYIYEEAGLVLTRTTKNDEEFEFVFAKQLKELKLPENAGRYNQAVKAFIDALPDETPILLNWG